MNEIFVHIEFISSYRSHDYLQQQQQQQQKNTTAEMDMSVLWCLGPDFDKQTVYSLLGDCNYVESGWPQPTTPNWLMSSPSQWSNSLMQEATIYTPRSVISELGPQSPTSGATKRPFSDVSNRSSSN
jgi:hypothetical protein